MDFESFDPLDYEANEGRKSRIKRYRDLLGLDEDFQITEENLSDYGIDYVANEFDCPRDRLVTELLGQRWSEYEKE